MPSLLIQDITPSNLNKLDENILPVAIIKAEKGKKNTLHNKYLCVDTSLNIKNPQKSIELKNGDCSFNIIPNMKDDGTNRTIYTISGPSGVGKSYMAKSIANYYSKMFPDRKILCISQLDEDDTLDEIKNLIRLDHNDFPNNPPNINTLTNCLIIFDDIEGLNKNVDDAVHKFLIDALTMGRTHCIDKNSGEVTQGNVSIIYICHNTSRYKKTRQLLTESHYVIYFPKHTNVHQIHYVLKSYFGFSKKQLNTFRKFPICPKRKWVAYHSKFPFYLLSAYKCELINEDDEEDE